jgi:hypothetical protein
MAGFATVVALIFRALIFRALMSEQPRPDREKVPVAGIIAGDWIVAHDEDQGEAVQLLWRTGHRAPSGELGWSLKTSAGIRHFDRDEWVYRVTSTEHPVVLDIVDAVDAEVSLEAVHALVLEEERSAEASLIRSVFAAAAIAIPLSIGIWVGLVALAVGDKDPAWGAWLGMAAAIGLLNGVFFGALAGFITKAHVLDDVDQHATTVVEAERAHRSDIQHRGDPET